MDTLTPPPARAAGHLSIGLLGGFTVAVDGEALPAERWSSLRAAHLVQLLSLQAGRRATKDLIIDALWPRLEPDAGAANLRKSVFHARQALGRHDAITVTGRELVLWPQGDTEVDVETFEALAEAALRAGDPAACAAAARHYTGDVLPGSCYEPWTEPVRERLRARLLALLRASAQWERLATLEPTDEAAHRELMQQALEAGNRASALHWFAHLREALQHELGVTPDARTQALYDRCIAGLQAEGPALVGRAAERARIDAWLQMPADQRPGGIVLQGPAGIGKSALSRAVETTARQRGWQVLRVDATESGQPYGVVIALAERLILQDRGVLDRMGAPARAVLAQLTPLAAPARALAGPLSRHQVVGAVRRLLVCSHPGSDVLLQVDDAHLAEASDAEVLVQLTMAGAPVCVLMTVRPQAQDAALARGLARLQRVGALKLLDVPALDSDEVGRLVQRVMARAVDEQQTARIAERSEGNPFVAIELARCAASGGLHRLPASTSEAIAARLCDAPPSSLALLDWLALAGDECDVGTATALAAQAGVAAFSALEGALGAGVLVVSGGRYAFRHALVREALLARMAPHRRVRMHRLIAEALAAGQGAPARIAAHWQAGGLPREAVAWWLAAARESMRLAAFGDALHQLEPLLATDAGHVEALRLRAEALDAQGDPAALFAYRLAANAAGEPDSHDLRAKAALAQVKQGDPKGALLALQGIHPTSVEGRLCEALAWSGAAALGAADPAMGTEKAAIARQLALQTGDTSSLVIASWAQAAAAHARGELHRSVWADLHETRHVPHLAVRVFDGHLCITQRFLYGARPYADVIAFADAFCTEARRIGAARGLAFGTTLRGEAAWLAGDVDAARLHLREGARLHRAISGPVGEALSLQRLAEVALHEGRRDEARALIDEALDVARQTDIGFHLLDRIYGTRISLHGDDPAAALHVMEDASEAVRGPLETCPGCRITFAVPAAIAAARAGAIDLAHEHEAQCAYLADVVMRLPAWYAAHQEVRGHLGVAEGQDGNEVASRFDAAARRFREAGQPLDAQRCATLADQAASGRRDVGGRD